MAGIDIKIRTGWGVIHQHKSIRVDQWPHRQQLLHMVHSAVMGFFDVNVKGVEVKQVYVGVGLDKASTLVAQKRHAVGGMDLDPAGHNAFAHRGALRANVHRMDNGARHALADVGLDGPEAAHDIRELRNLLDAFNEAKKTAGLTVIKLVVTGLVMAILMGTLIKLKLFGGAQ